MIRHVTFGYLISMMSSCVHAQKTANAFSCLPEVFGDPKIMSKMHLRPLTTLPKPCSHTLPPLSAFGASNLVPSALATRRLGLGPSVPRPSVMPHHSFNAGYGPAMTRGSIFPWKLGSMPPKPYYIVSRYHTCHDPPRFLKYCLRFSSLSKTCVFSFFSENPSSGKLTQTRAYL